MGYVTSASTTYLDLHMTMAGRKLLLQGSLSDTITQFAIGDTDVDYRNATGVLPAGYVPDVTGSHLNCIFGVNDGYDIKRKLEYVLGQTTLNQTVAQTGQIVSAFKNSSGTLEYASDANVTFYVADMFTGLKALAMTQIGFHQWNGLTANTFTDYYKTISDSSGRNYGGRYTQLFEDMEYGLGRGWFVALSEGFYASVAGNIQNVSITVEPESPKDSVLLRKLSSAAFVSANNTTITNSTDRSAKIGTKRTRAYVSPFTVAVSGLKNSEGGTYNGSGPLSICNALGDYGYVLGDIINKKVGYYPEYGIGQDAGGYYHPQIIENSNYAQTINESGLDTLAPAARILDNNNAKTNYYYPLQTNQLNTDPGDRRFQGKSAGDYLGTTGVRNSTTSTETALNFFVGTPELELSNQSTGRQSLSLRTVRPNMSQEPNLGLTRIVKQTEDFFYALSKDPECSNWVTVSGTGKNAVYSFTINLRVSPQLEKDRYKSAKLALSFVFSIPALQPTLTWVEPTPETGGRWLMFGDSTVQIFGEGYKSLAGHYATNPTNLVNVSGGSIYRKVIINQ